MIYTLFSFVKKDCHDGWQSPTEYSKEQFSDKSRLIDAEWRLARILLSYGLEKIYSITEWDLQIDSHGKPRLTDYVYDGVIHISISHSLGAVAVCLSDTNEMGIDIQAEINPDTEKRLNERFFTDVRVINQPLDLKIFYLTDGGELCNVILDAPADDFDFTDKWAYCESIMKCNGKGFLSSPDINKISKEFITEIKKLITNNKSFSLAISIKKTAIM